MRFLVVDDSRAMQSIVKRGLQLAGYKNMVVKLASNGYEALDIIRVWKPDLVLSDWHMPEMDGIELLARIQREMLDIHVGLVTTENTPEKIKLAINAGAKFVVSKPFSHDQLIQAVLSALQERDESKESDSVLTDEKSAQPNSHFILPSATGFTKIVNGISPSEILVEQVPPISIGKIQLPCVLGLFDDGETEVIRAVCVLELRTACILGAAMSGISAEQMQTSIASETIDKQLLDGCKKLLDVVSAAIYDSVTRSDLQLRTINVIPRIFPKLEEIYSQNAGERSDFEVAVPGFGQGLMTIITA